MPANVELKWASGPKRTKATQIPEDVWKGYESEIREMYTSMTLDELAADMKRIHGFEATSRQYTARLERWGLKKYKTKNAAAEVMAESTDEEDDPWTTESNQIDLQGFSTAILEGSKRRRNALDIDKCDTEDTQDLFSGTSSAKKLKVDDKQAALHQSQVPTLAESRNATDSDGAISKYTIEDLPAGSLHDRQGRILSEATVQSILGHFKFVNQHAVQNIHIDWCLGIASLIKNFQRPRQGLKLSFNTEKHLKVIANYLFAMDSFAEATNIYIIIAGSERSHTSFSASFYTSTFISAVRAARSEEDCLSLQINLGVRKGSHAAKDWSPLERGLADMLSTNLFSRLQPDLKTSSRGSVVRSMMFRAESQRDFMDDSSILLLVYAYYKWLYCSSSASSTLSRSEILAQGKLSISHVDFVDFFKESHIDVRLRAISVRDTLRGSLHWCLEASSWVQSAFLSDLNTRDELGTFANLWRTWHEPYSFSLNSPGWTLEQSLGISLAEHFTICAKVMHLLAKSSPNFHERDYTVTLYLQTLYERIGTFRQPALSTGADDSVSRHVSMAHRMPTSMHSPMSDLKIPNLASTIAPSLESTRSSYGRFKEASAAMAFQRQKEASFKSGTASSTPGIKYSLYGSNPPSMSFLSEMFTRSCNVSMSSTPQGSSPHKSSSQHSETTVNVDAWMDLEMDVV